MGRWSQNFRSFGSPEFATLGFKAYCFEMFVLKRDWGFPSGTRKTAAHPSTFLPLLRGDPMLLSVYDHSGYKKKKKKRSCNFQVLFALCLLPTELNVRGAWVRGICVGVAILADCQEGTHWTHFTSFWACLSTEIAAAPFQKVKVSWLS